MVRKVPGLLSLFAISLVLGGLQVFALEVDGEGFAFALKVKQPPKVDGLLDEECWKNASWRRLSISFYRPAEIESRFAVCYDESEIYFAVECYEPSPDKIAAEPNESGKEAWPEGDSAEIFLDPGLTRTVYYQFAANTLGVQFDQKCPTPGISWNSGWTSKAKIGEDRWCIEMAIPFASFGRSEAPEAEVWGLNVNRNRRVVVWEPSSWANVGAYFHSPGKFGKLVFGNPAEVLKGKFLPGLSRRSKEAEELLKSVKKRHPELEEELARRKSEISSLEESLSGRVVLNEEEFVAEFRTISALKEKIDGLLMETQVLQAIYEN